MLTGRAGTSGGAAGAGAGVGSGAAGLGGSGAAGIGGAGAATPWGNVVLHDANNYAATASLSIPVVQTAPGADLRICWSSLAKDLRCHDLVPTIDIDNVAFMQIPNVTRNEVAGELLVGQLDENLLRVYGDYHVDQTPTSTCASLSQFKLGEYVVPATDYVADPNTTYLLLFATGTTPVVGSRSMLFLEPTSASSVTAVDAVDACAANAFNFRATFGQPMPISQTDSAKWDLDWSQITRDSFANAVRFTKIDGVQVGFYQNLTAAELEARFIDIDLIATALYEVPVAVGARHVDLANARLRGTNETFPGFTRTDGVWAVAVRCSKCQIPEPVVFTVLQPE